VTKEGSGLRVELSQINTVAWEKHDARLHVTLKNGERVLVTTKTNVLRLDKSALHLDGAERSLSVRQRELAQVHERIANAEAALAAPVTATQWQIESAAELEKAKAAVPAAITNARDAWNSADFVNRMLAYSSYEPTASEGNELRALSRRLRALDEKIEIQTLLERPAPALNAERADLVAKMEASEAAIKAKLAPNEVDFLASREVYFGRVNSSDAPESLRTRLNEVRLAESLVAIADGEANRERAHLVASYTNVTSNGPSAIAQAEAAVVAAQKVVEDAKQTPKIEVVTVSPQT
jgi:exonuclease VII large subunit